MWFWTCFKNLFNVIETIKKICCLVKFMWIYVKRILNQVNLLSQWEWWIIVCDTMYRIIYDDFYLFYSTCVWFILYIQLNFICYSSINLLFHYPTTPKEIKKYSKTYLSKNFGICSGKILNTNFLIQFTFQWIIMNL